MLKRIVVVCTLLVAVGGCSNDQEPVTDDPSPVDGALEEPSTGSDAGASELTGEVLATATGVDGSLPLRLELNAVRRQGETASITFGVTNDGNERWQVATFFDGPFREDLDTSFTLAGVSLIDTVNGRRYPVVFGEDGVCACDNDLSSRFVGAGETGRFSAVFGAPPREVTTVDVQVPGFGIFNAVPLGE